MTGGWYEHPAKHAAGDWFKKKHLTLIRCKEVGHCNEIINHWSWINSPEVVELVVGEEGGGFGRGIDH